MTGLQQAVADANVFLNETASPFLKKLLIIARTGRWSPYRLR